MAGMVMVMVMVRESIVACGIDSATLKCSWFFRVVRSSPVISDSCVHRHSPTCLGHVTDCWVLAARASLAFSSALGPSIKSTHIL